MRTSSSASPAEGSLLRTDVRFRRYFAGASTSAVGDRITFIALPFAVLSISDSAGAVALVIAAQTLPFALFALLAGVLADRRDRRRMVLASDLVRALCQATAATLLLTGTADVWHLAVLAAMYGAADACFMPATAGMLPQLVAGPRLQEANALRGLVDSSAMIVGPAMAGGLIALLGVGGAIAVDAATFLVSFACLATVVPDAVGVRPAGHAEATILDGLREGFREVRAHRWITTGLAGMCVYTVVVLPSVFVLGPVLAQRSLGGAESWALIAASFGCGSLIGNAIALRWRPRRPMVAVALGMTVASTQAAIIGSGAPVAGIAAMEAVAGIGVSLFFTIWDSALQENVSEHALSRVTSYDFFLSVGLSGVGVAIAGPVAEAAGLQTTLLLMTAIGVTTSLAMLATPSVRALRRDVGAAATPVVPGT